ncbi:SDR family NAD(P)-dependent oxidoreductase [Thalassobacillus hwangdonensis]|uniref:SDR family NAD(P)-dependent oxidoreductase n=1 Tax=Thalassobacillus hwangdonensis TaxID=546108 RepID=A0ABW3L193_9BACI
MKKAIVLGATGGMGSALTLELAGRGISVTAFARNKEKLQKLFGNSKVIKIHEGDVFDKESLSEACAGHEVIFHAINIPYPEWAVNQPVLIENILHATKENGAKLAIVDNIYAYGMITDKKVAETDRKAPHTKKGKLRLKLEEQVKSSGVEYCIAHFPDFYGPHAGNSLLNYTLNYVVRNKRAGYMGDHSIEREFIYTPDGAKAMVNIASETSAYGQNWNVPGSRTIAGSEVIEIVRANTEYTKKVGTITKPMIRLLGWVNPMMREYVEMYYLNKTPVVLSGEKYKAHFGELPSTPYEQGIPATLDSLRSFNA